MNLRIKSGLALAASIISALALGGCNRQKFAGSATIHDLVPVPDPLRSTVTLASPTVVAGTSVGITINAVDQVGNLFISSSPLWAIRLQGGGSKGTFVVPTSNGDGTYSASFTGSVVGAASLVIPSYNSVDFKNPPTIKVTNCSLSLANTVVSTAASVVGVGLGIPVTVTAKDCLGNVMTSGGSTVAFSIAGGTGVGSFSSVVDNGNGTYTSTFTGVTVGSATTLQATVNGSALTSTLPTVSVIPGLPSVSNSVVSVSAATLNSGNTVTLTLTAKDTGGNSISTGGALVGFSFSGGTSTGTIGSVTDNNNGTYTATFSGLASGTATTVHATIGGVSVTSTLPTLTVNVGALSLSQSNITVSSAAVNSGSTVTLTLIARDVSGNQMTSGGLTVTLSNSGGTSAGSIGSVTDNGNGTYTAVFTSTTSGTATTIRGTIGGSSVTSTLPTITVSPGGPSLSQSVITVSAATVLSGSSITLTLTVKDPAGNQQTTGGQSIVFSYSGGVSTGSISSITDNNNGTYTATFTGVIAGTATSIHATIGGSTVTSASPTETVGVGPLSLSVSTITTTSTTVLFNNTATLKVTAKDAAGNTFTGGGLTITFSATGGTSGFSIGSVTDNSNGTYTAVFTGTSPGSAMTIGAKIGGLSITSTQPTVTVLGLSLEVPIEIIDSGIASQTTSTAYDTSRTNLDPTAYDGYPAASYYFEIVASNSDTASRNVVLIDSSGATKGTLAVAAGASIVRSRVAFTPNGSADNYRLNLAGTTSAGQLSVFTARILVQQPNATKTKIYVPLLAAAYNTASTTVPNSIENTQSVTYTQTTAANYQLWKKNNTNFATVAATNPWQFDAIIWTDSGTCYASLYNATSSSQVTNSEVSTTNTSATLLSASFADSATNFADTSTYQAKIKSTFLKTCNIAKAGLWLSLTSLTKGEVYYRISKQYNNLSAAIITPYNRILLNPSLFSAATLNEYYETTAWVSPIVSTLNIQADDNGTNDSGTSGTTAVTGCTIPGSSLGTTRALFRSSSCSGIVNGDRYINELIASSGSITSTAEFVVFVFGP